ncbi:MAG: hypothetical protein SFW36_04910 [Leptolyngbyaceae cyanobacterium bins.59]|nr:hypothetical protein [Leptolyngbyaceae cyanobacterium bins.59]
MPRYTITPATVEAVRKALEELASKPKNVTERDLIATHKDLIQRALDRGYDFGDIARVSEAVGVTISATRIRKYYREVQGIPVRTRRSSRQTQPEADSSTTIKPESPPPTPKNLPVPPPEPPIAAKIATPTHSTRRGRRATTIVNDPPLGGLRSDFEALSPEPEPKRSRGKRTAAQSPTESTRAVRSSGSQGTRKTRSARKRVG